NPSTWKSSSPSRSLNVPRGTLHLHPSSRENASTPQRDPRTTALGFFPATSETPNSTWQSTIPREISTSEALRSQFSGENTARLDNTKNNDSSRPPTLLTTSWFH